MSIIRHKYIAVILFIFFVIILIFIYSLNITEATKLIDGIKINQVFLDRLIEFVEHIIGEFVGFSSLALLFVYFFKREFIEVIKKGAERIADILSRHLDLVRIDTLHALTEVEAAAKAARERFEDKSTHMTEEKVDTSVYITDLLKAIEQEISERKYVTAEQKLLKLHNDYKNDFSIITEIYSLYSNKDYQRTINGCHQKLLAVLLNSEDKFSDNPSFYRLLSSAYIDARYIITEQVAKRLSCEAIKKSIELQKENPRWEVLLGFHYYVFDDIEEAVRVSKPALSKAIKIGDERTAALAKNNLAFFFATKLVEKELAFEYANSAVEYFSQCGNADHAMAKDTLGYVYMQFAHDYSDIEKAIELFQDAQDLDPDEDGYVNRWREAKRRLCVKKGGGSHT